MDPKQTLLDAQTAYAAGDFQQAKDHLENYFRWRNGLGFEPTIGTGGVPVPGDKYAEHLVEGLARKGY